MSRTPDQLLAEALELPPSDRAHLAESLISSLDDAEEVDPAELEQTWLAEASRRASEIDAGTVETTPAAAVFRAAREELRRMRAPRG
ncbi:MAG: addiction module protein [Gemmatimonadota bacterium]|nr:addiction module protein [Gemmatimonadota bacterium]